MKEKDANISQHQPEASSWSQGKGCSASGTRPSFPQLPPLEATWRPVFRSTSGPLVWDLASEPSVARLNQMSWSYRKVGLQSYFWPKVSTEWPSIDTLQPPLPLVTCFCSNNMPGIAFPIYGWAWPAVHHLPALHELTLGILRLIKHISCPWRTKTPTLEPHFVQGWLSAHGPLWKRQSTWIAGHCYV